MSVKSTILGILKPTIKLKEIKIPDQETPESDKKLSNARDNSRTQELSKTLGVLSPLVQIRDIRIEYEHLSYFEIDLFGKIPRLTVNFKDLEGRMNIEVPLDGDIIAVYLKAPDSKTQRPIRIDFDILDINSDPISKSYSISGIMKIPGLYKEICKGLNDNTSFEHLQDISEELKIGFASNEVSTSDSMERIIPFTTYEEFIRDTVSCSYLDDNSFFDWYIDPFYYLCFVNVNKQISTNIEPQITTITSVMNTGSIPTNKELDQDAAQSFEDKLILTNDDSKGAYNIFISNWSTQSNFATKWINNGYKRILQFLDIDEKNKDTQYLNNIGIESLTTEGAEKNYIILKGEKGDDFYKEQIKYKWLGKQMTKAVGGHVHDNYTYSNILNYQNLQDLTKMNLSVIVNGINLNIYKYMSIPVMIYEKGTEKINKLMKRDEELEGDEDHIKTIDAQLDPEIESRPIGTDPEDLILNKFISGNYIVTGLAYIYTKGAGIKTRMQLSRREWPIPALNDNIS